MGVKTYNAGAKIKYNFNRKAGRNIIEHKPVFSPDGESLVVIVENIVRVYNVETGECTRILETENPVCELVAIQFPDNEGYNLYGCSDSGCVTTWTWENGAVLREIKLPTSTGAKVLAFNLLDSIECLLTFHKHLSQYINTGLYSLKSGQQIHTFNIGMLYYPNMTCVAVGWCNGERFAALTNGTTKMTIQNVHRPDIKETLLNTSGIRIISVSEHTTESSVVMTDALGRVTICRGNLFCSSSIVKEILHWHFLPTTAACFSVQGSYLYSGGLERVLVKWTVGNLATRANEKMFIPRLPGNIRYITTNNTYVAVTLSNNSIVIANAQLRVIGTILECGGLSPAARSAGPPLIHHSRLEGLLMGGRTGHLQLYSTATDKVLYNIDITGANNIPAERYNLIPLETEVACAAVSANGTWLVTSEYRNDGTTFPEERLKFWMFQAKSTTPFVLNTCVNLSHGGCKIVSIALSDIGEVCVTAGADQKFRIWKRGVVSQTRRKKTEAWSCLTACYYSSGVAQFISHGIFNDYKNGSLPPAKGEEYPYLRDFENKHDIIRKLVNIHKEHNLLNESVVNVGMRRDDNNDMAGVAISHDGSLIAAWFGCKLTLWDTHLCNLRTTLSHPALRPKGVNVQFGNKDAGHYLVCTTDNCLAVWSILSLTMKWLVQLDTTCLTADPLSNRLAVVTTNNDVYVFTPHSSTPILTQKKLRNPSTGVFKQCTFGTSSNDYIRLYLVRNDSEVYCLEPEQTQEGRLEVISRRHLPTSNFSALMAEQQLSEVRPATGAAAPQLNTDGLGNTAIAQFLSAAPHMIPPVSLLCTSFLQHISGHQHVEPKEEQDDAMEVDEPSSDEETADVKLNGPYAPKILQLWTPNYEKIKGKRLQKIVNEQLLDLHVTEAIFGV